MYQLASDTTAIRYHAYFEQLFDNHIRRVDQMIVDLPCLLIQ